MDRQYVAELVREAAQTRDRRNVVVGAASWSQGPIPVVILRDGHAQAQLVGRITAVWREHGSVWGDVTLHVDQLDRPDRRALRRGQLVLAVQFIDVTFEPYVPLQLMLLTGGRIVGACLTPRELAPWPNMTLRAA